MKYWKFILIPTIIFVLIFILLFHPEILNDSISRNYTLPLGTFISWLLVFLITLFSYLIFKVKKDVKFDSRLKQVLLVNVFIGFLWGFISYLLSGNWSFIFEKKTVFVMWIIFTGLIVFIPIFIFITRSIKRLIGHMISKNK